ncbi:MAG: nucleoside monophosphate kinase [bacterium]
MQFPIFKTKLENETRKFNLTDPKEKEEYFELKAGEEIRRLKSYLDKNTFIVYLLGKKSSGKGTYSKMLAEIIGPEKIEHFSVGDMVRAIDEELADETKKEELYDFLRANYRGFMPLEEIIAALENRSTKVLLPTELILVLIEREIARRPKKTLFIDGFPRDLDQVSYSLFFRQLIGYRDDKDVFVMISLPEKVIDERIKWRKICPACKTSRNLKLLPTSKIGYDEDKKEFYLICDNPACQEVRMVQKEGDELGIEPIKERLATDGRLIEKSFSLHGIPKILLRNSVPVEQASEFVDDYEITPEYVMEWDEKEKKVNVTERPWVIKDDDGIDSCSLLAPAVVVSLIKQLAEILEV